MNEEDFQPIRFLNYLKHRANYQGVPLALDEGFIMESFHVGVRYFFGVTIDDKGMPIHDREQPHDGFLEEWLERSIN